MSDEPEVVLQKPNLRVRCRGQLPFAYGSREYESRRGLQTETLRNQGRQGIVHQELQEPPTIGSSRSLTASAA